MTESNVNDLRERVAVTEATVRSHGEMLEEMKDAVKGINSSLHTLTRLEERAVSAQEMNSATRQMIVEEKTACEKRTGIAQKKLESLEAILTDQVVSTSVNSHGRTFWEKTTLPMIAAVLGPILAVALTLWYTSAP